MGAVWELGSRGVSDAFVYLVFFEGSVACVILCLRGGTGVKVVLWMCWGGVACGVWRSVLSGWCIAWLRGGGRGGEFLFFSYLSTGNILRDCDCGKQCPHS